MPPISSYHRANTADELTFIEEMLQLISARAVNWAAPVLREIRNAAFSRNGIHDEDSWHHRQRHHYLSAILEL